MTEWEEAEDLHGLPWNGGGKKDLIAAWAESHSCCFLIPHNPAQSS